FLSNLVTKLTGKPNWFQEICVLKKGKLKRQCGNEGSKSPSPDGYNFKFIKSFRPMLKSDIVKVVRKFHNPQGSGDFRPISLIGCMYKIIAKILSKRIKRVLEKLIDERQYVFMGGRNMLDGFL
ncbi:hypothetical protein CR513_61372, partial [Mucuna pruriens]